MEKSDARSTMGVSTSAEYCDAKPVKVWYVLVYREGSLSTEIRQIAPALQMTP